MATIHDKDILLYCISQLVAKMNAGLVLDERQHKTLNLKAYDLLVATNRNTDRRGYEQLEAALDRLSGTRIKTNIRTNKEAVKEGFGLIDSWRIIRNTKSERMSEIELTLSKWVFNAVKGREVLTLHRDYFRLRKPLERLNVAFTSWVANIAAIRTSGLSLAVCSRKNAARPQRTLNFDASSAPSARKTPCTITYLTMPCRSRATMCGL